MVIDPDTGVVSLETPELGGPYTVEIRADNAFGSDTEDWALTVTECTGPCAATPASTLGTTSTPKSIPFGFLALVPMAALAVLRVRKRIV
jgi:hypothetical protein